MGRLIYDVAVSVDGFIARSDGSVSGFLMEGPHVDAYLQRLCAYRAVVMGRRTYEWGYAYGLSPGARPYPHLETFVVSSRIALPAEADVTVTDDALKTIMTLKERFDGDVYLCGGGRLAGTLAAAGLIDRLILKSNPVAFGSGIGLFDGIALDLSLHRGESRTWDNGVTEVTFDLAHGRP